MNRVAAKCVFAAVLVLASGRTARSQPLEINTLAGQPAPGSSDGLVNLASFSQPLGVAADGAGNVYVADAGNGTIRKINSNGFTTTFAGAPGIFGSTNGTGPSARFYGPQGIALASSGDVFVADSANGTIRRITPAGVVSTFAGAPGEINSFDGLATDARFSQPEALAVDGAGTVYVADAWNHTIRKITPAGVVSTLAGLAGNPGAADGTNSKARFNRPVGIALDSATNLFVTDSLNHVVRKITPAGTVSTIAGMAGVWGSADGTNNAARFFQPHGIVADGPGGFLVADSGNQTVRRISAAGTNWVVSTVAGEPGNPGNSDGTGGAARFRFPAGAARDSAGALHVADLGNNSVRTTRTVSPVLQASFQANQLVLTWPEYLTGFVLEKADSVAPVSVWTAVTNGVAFSGSNHVLTNSAGGLSAFYRLHKQ